MANEPLKAPPAYRQFVECFPELGEAWELIRKAEAAGPLAGKMRRLVKLAIAVGREAEGATHSGVRKALDAGATRQEIEQVVALAASTLGLPATVKIHCWVREVLG